MFCCLFGTELEFSDWPVDLHPSPGFDFTIGVRLVSRFCVPALDGCHVSPPLIDFDIHGSYPIIPCPAPAWACVFVKRSMSSQSLPRKALHDSIAPESGNVFSLHPTLEESGEATHCEYQDMSNLAASIVPGVPLDNQEGTGQDRLTRWQLVRRSAQFSRPVRPDQSSPVVKARITYTLLMGRGLERRT